MKKSTYFAKSTVTADVSAALRTYFARAWTEGQPAKQVLPDLQQELERMVAAASAGGRVDAVWRPPDAS